MAPKPAARVGTLAGKVLAEVATLARELDRGELTFGATTEADLAIAVTVWQSAAFSVESEAGKGALPQGVEALSSLAALQARLGLLLQTAQQEAGSLIDRWADEAAAEYRAVMPAGRCIVNRPVVGVEEVCGACNGRRRLRCPVCQGAQVITCPTCRGQGQIRCPRYCDGGWHDCSSCFGQGSIEKTELELTPGDVQNTMNQQRQLTRRVPCLNCTNGRVRCDVQDCHEGWVKCRECKGNREVECKRCRAIGTVPCDDCDETGAVHEMGSIRCEVSRRVWVEVDSANAEDQYTLRERTPPDQLGRLATDTGGIWGNRGVLLDRRRREGLELTARYTATVRLECIEATAGGARVTLRAYGPGREIYNYHQLIGRLLEADLAKLEKAVQGRPLLKATAGVSLAALMKRFLASEVNGKSAEEPGALGPLVKAEMLHPQYIQRAQAAMGKAASLLYGPLALPLALWGTAGLTVLFWVMRTNFSAWSLNEKVFGMLAATAGGWVVVENRVRVGLKTILGRTVYGRLKAHFDKARNLYRLLPVAGFLFAWYLTSLPKQAG